MGIKALLIGGNNHGTVLQLSGVRHHIEVMPKMDLPERPLGRTDPRPDDAVSVEHYVQVHPITTCDKGHRLLYVEEKVPPEQIVELLMSLVFKYDDEAIELNRELDYVKRTGLFVQQTPTDEEAADKSGCALCKTRADTMAEPGTQRPGG